MSLNKESSDRLFDKPSIEWIDPKVVTVGVDDITPSVTISKDKYTKHVEGLRFLSRGFDGIALEYDKLIQILIRRADLRNIAYPAAEKAKGNLLIANAIKQLYGTQIKQIVFVDYIKLLEHEQKLASAHTAALVSPEKITLPTTDAANNIMANPEINAINVIKRDYKNYLVEMDAEDLLLIDILIYNKYVAGSNKSLIREVATTTDGNALDAVSDNIDNKSKIEELVKECLPCLERTIDLLGEYPKGGVWGFFKDEVWRHFLSQLQQLARLKLAILSFQFGAGLCSLINMFANSVCLPDLVAVVALIKMMIARTRFLLIGKFNLSLGSPLNDMVSLIVSPILDALIALLVRVINGVLSPIDCVLTSIEKELNKIFPAINEVFNTEIDANIGFSPRRHANELIESLIEGRNQIETQVLTFINEKTKDWDLKLTDENEALDLYINLDQYTRTAGMIYEIIDLFKNVGKAIQTGLTDEEKRQRYRDICQHSISFKKPWLQVIRIDNPPPDDDDGGGGGDEGDGDILPDPRDRDDDIIDIDIDDGIIIIDITIDDDIFDDDDIIDILDDPIVREILEDLGYPETVEGGEHPLKLDNEFLKRYNIIKQSVKDTITKVDSIKSMQDVRMDDAIVTSTVNFNDCINLYDLDGSSKQQIQNWIDITTGSK